MGMLLQFSAEKISQEGEISRLIVRWWSISERVTRLVKFTRATWDAIWITISNLLLKSTAAVGILSFIYRSCMDVYVHIFMQYV